MLRGPASSNAARSSKLQRCWTSQQSCKGQQAPALPDIAATLQAAARCRPTPQQRYELQRSQPSLQRCSGAPPPPSPPSSTRPTFVGISRTFVERPFDCRWIFVERPSDCRWIFVERPSASVQLSSTSVRQTFVGVRPTFVDVRRLPSVKLPSDVRPASLLMSRPASGLRHC